MGVPCDDCRPVQTCSLGNPPTPRRTFNRKVFFYAVVLKVKISKVNAKLQITYFCYSYYSLYLHYGMKKNLIVHCQTERISPPEVLHMKFFTMHLYQKVNKCTYFLNAPKKNVYDLCFSGRRLVKCMDCAKKYGGFGDANFRRSIFCRGFKLHKKNSAHFSLCCSFTSNL